MTKWLPNQEKLRSVFMPLKAHKALRGFFASSFYCLSKIKTGCVNNFAQGHDATFYAHNLVVSEGLCLKDMILLTKNQGRF